VDRVRTIDDVSRRPVLASASVLGLAAGGVLLGHALTYAGLEPRAVVRETWLAATGHGYLTAANRIGLAAVVLALAFVFLRGLCTLGDRARRAPTARLVAFQLTALVGLEIFERLGSHASLGDLPKVLVTGLTIQAAIAVGCAALLGLVKRAAERTPRTAARAAAPARRPDRVLPLQQERSIRRSAPLGTGNRGRAPPAFA